MGTSPPREPPGPDAPPIRRTAMIGLTRRTGEHCRLDPDHIEQVITRIIEYRAGDIAACYVLDRGEDADPQRLGGTAPQARGPVRLP